MSPVIIFGAAGFLGSWLLRHLINRYGDGVFGFDLPGRKICGGGGEIDILDGQALESLVNRYRPRAVINCTGLLASRDPLQLFKINALGSLNIINAIEKVLGCKCRVLLIGSAAEYGIVSENDLPIAEEYPLNPVSYYGVSKAAQTFFARAAASRGLDTVTARIFNLIGPGLSQCLSLSNFARQMASIERGNNTIIETGYLGSRRDYIDIIQAVRALEVLLENGLPGEEYNICSGFSWPMKELLNILADMIPERIDIVEKIKVPVALDAPDIVGSMKKLNALGFKVTPTDMRKELKVLLDYWRNILVDATKA